MIFKSPQEVKFKVTNSKQCFIRLTSDRLSDNTAASTVGNGWRDQIPSRKTFKECSANTDTAGAGQWEESP